MIRGTVILSLVLFATSAIFVAESRSESAADEHPIYSQKMESLTGDTVNLDKYKGRVLLIVNTASRCGATPQYEPLQELHEKYSGKGLSVLGFPCNQFGLQESGTHEEIAAFCQRNYGVEFDMFAKIDVNGKTAAPIYRFLTSGETGLEDTGAVKWNFEKFLVSRDGQVLARFRTKTAPDSETVIKAIEESLSE